MARIIFSLISGLPNSSQLPCFYEGWLNALVKEGNEVMLIVTNNLMSKNLWRSNKTSRHINKISFDKVITNFNPDLVIAWNNSLYENIPKLVSCPIIIYGTDSPALFCDKDILKKNRERYHIVVPADIMVKMVKDYFGDGAKSLNVVHFASDFVAQEMVQDKPISFIGTDFSFAGDKFEKIFKKNFTEDDKRQLKEFFESFKKDVLKTPEYYLKELNIKNSIFDDILHSDLLNLISSNFRIQTLQGIADLGLFLYGSKSWPNLCSSSIDLALSFINQEVSSIKHNQDIYNSSKISINITHAQAGSAFSWRVRDIMACNSVLVSDFRQDLVTQFGKYVKIPTYENPYEARDLCQKLLKDEIWRKEIIAGSQLAIEEEHRFKYRVKDLSQVSGVDLSPRGEGKVIKIEPNDFKNHLFYDKILSKNGFIRRSNRQRNRIFRKIKKKFIP